MLAYFVCRYITIELQISKQRIQKGPVVKSLKGYGFYDLILYDIRPFYGFRNNVFFVWIHYFWVLFSNTSNIEKGYNAKINASGVKVKKLVWNRGVSSSKPFVPLDFLAKIWRIKKTVDDEYVCLILIVNNCKMCK